MSELTDAQFRHELNHAVSREPGFISASDRLVAHDAALRARVAELERDVNQLNNVLRQAGWGQGEIDSAAYTFDKLATANAGLMQQVKDLTAEKESAETERIEWVKRAERAEAVNEELRAELAAHTYTWTTARPTVAGLWFKKSAIGEPECVEVSHEHETGALIWMNFDTEWDWINRADVTCHWAGPIPLPEEGPAGLGSTPAVF